MKNNIRKLVLSIIVTFGMIACIGTVMSGKSYACIYETEKVDCMKNDNMLKEVLSAFSSYEEYYDFNKIIFEKIDNERDSGEEFFLSIQCTMKYNDVAEMDYYQGAKEAYEENIHKFNSSYEGEDCFKKTIDFLYNSIDEKQELIFYVLVDDGVVYASDGYDYILASEFLPCSHEMLFEQGYNAFLRNIENITATTHYSINQAVSYANTYSSNPNSCNLHSSCGFLVNTSLYNSSYTNYASTHTDCANYMSQALFAGGIPTDSTWYVGSTAWKGVISLTNFMNTKHYWCPTKTTDVAVGNFDVYSGGSHITMITSFDGVTYKFSAHTNDRLNATTSINNTHTYYRVVY